MATITTYNFFQHIGSDKFVLCWRFYPDAYTTWDWRYQAGNCRLATLSTYTALLPMKNSHVIFCQLQINIVIWFQSIYWGLLQ